MELFILLGIYCIQGAVWGWAVNKVVENKGYQENWFWWGFFFGLIALIVALTKPDAPRASYDGGSYFGDTSSIVGRGFGSERKADRAKGEWRCSHCGAINASYVGTCSCGWDKAGNSPGHSAEQTQENTKAEQTQQNTKTEQPQQNAKAEQTQQPSMLYCTSCGRQVEADSRYCRYCGAKQQ